MDSISNDAVLSPSSSNGGGRIFGSISTFNTGRRMAAIMAGDARIQSLQAHPESRLEQMKRFLQWCVPFVNNNQPPSFHLVKVSL
ncbi:hypothetical protein V6N11_072451 [Hibiscus sabdariffa]|uniref:Uncharacterized protein n=1 Tax=Hibiscus sabdariffa TaxID=183260 RepID=A0ABR2U3T4_9ROSI